MAFAVVSPTSSELANPGPEVAATASTSLRQSLLALRVSSTNGRVKAVVARRQLRDNPSVWRVQLDLGSHFGDDNVTMGIRDSDGRFVAGSLNSKNKASGHDRQEP